jgi:hypothetical protein
MGSSAKTTTVISKHAVFRTPSCVKAAPVLQAMLSSVPDAPGSLTSSSGPPRIAEPGAQLRQCPAD